MYEVTRQLGRTDIYVIDQILKGRYVEGDTILDAGCGTGRNLKWFTLNGFTLFGVDMNAESIMDAKQTFPELKDNLEVGTVESLRFDDCFFDHIICSAVLHFAQNENHFVMMFKELIRVLKQNGTLLVRMASSIGIEGHIIPRENGIYGLKDGTERFLLTHSMYENLLLQNNLSPIEPLKLTIVEDLRCMATFVLTKGNVESL